MRRWTAAVVVGAAALSLGGMAQAEPEVGLVVQQDYSGALGTRIASEPEALEYFTRVFAEERVETGASAKTSLQFLDKTSLYVGARSSVVLDRFVYDPNTQSGEAAINFTKGAFRFVTGNIKTKEAVSLSTPTASIVIRGTHLLIFVLPDGTSEVNVLEGAVDLTPCQSTEAQRINAGQRMTITASCGTDRTTARGDDQSAGLIPQMPTELAAIEDVAPAAGDEDPPYVIPEANEETGKGGERDRDRDGRQGGRDGKY